MTESMQNQQVIICSKSTLNIKINAILYYNTCSSCSREGGGLKQRPCDVLAMHPQMHMAETAEHNEKEMLHCIAYIGCCVIQLAKSASQL